MTFVYALALYGPMVVLLFACLIVPYRLPFRVRHGAIWSKAIKRFAFVASVMVGLVTSVTLIGQWGASQLFIDALSVSELRFRDLLMTNIGYGALWGLFLLIRISQLVLLERSRKGACL